MWAIQLIGLSITVRIVSLSLQRKIRLIPLNKPIITPNSFMHIFIYSEQVGEKLQSIPNKAFPPPWN